MKIHELVRSTGLVDKSNQRGRWNGSKGNTSGKWHKWQKARSGHKYKWAHEGWQTPLVQRMPKMRWFKRHFKLVTEITAINLNSLEKNKKIASWSHITKEILVSLGIISQVDQKVKILGTGEFTKSLQFDGVDYFSASAKDKIETAGGTIKSQVASHKQSVENLETIEDAEPKVDTDTTVANPKVASTKKKSPVSKPKATSKKPTKKAV